MTRAISTSATAEVAVHPTTVWTFVSDLHRYADWVHGTVEVLAGDPVALPGATYTERNRVVGPITARSNWTVVEVDRERGSQRHESDGMPGVPRFAVLIRVEPAPIGTRITLTLEADIEAGPATGLVARILERSLRASNETSVDQLAQVLVADADSDLSGGPVRPVSGR